MRCFRIAWHGVLAEARIDDETTGRGEDVELITREELKQKLDAAKREVDQIDSELRFVYKVDESIHGARTRHSSLAELVGRSGRFLGINYSVLLIPSKRFRISATHST